MSKNIKAVAHELNTGQYAGMGRRWAKPAFICQLFLDNSFSKSEYMHSSPAGAHTGYST